MAIEGTFLTYVRETVTILRPMKSSVARGVTSDHEQAPTMSFRLPDDARENIRQASVALDMPVSAFIRWAAVAAATDILKQKSEYDNLHGKV